ncbi:MAG: hypothetical protein SAK29_22465 [Scytonema sp. PMC 1069.18]|nr:hypothetical protein [Scytonema sp. PMC 1069.18]MEC4879724.1 hypothetical protein [Scytonema sp. PMC 1070.18]
MRLILAILNKALHQSIVVLGLILFISLSGVFFFVQQPSYAVTYPSQQLTPEEKIDRAYEYSEGAGIREEDRQEAYQQAVKDSQSLQTMEKAYERNVEEENAQPTLGEKAKELIDTVTGK